MDVLRRGKGYTVDDIYALPDGQRAELIGGQIYYMASPSLTHQRMLAKLSQIISSFPCSV